MSVDCIRSGYNRYFEISMLELIFILLYLFFNECIYHYGFLDLVSRENKMKFFNFVLLVPEAFK
jgi:hypothetical protein